MLLRFLKNIFEKETALKEKEIVLYLFVHFCELL